MLKSGKKIGTFLAKFAATKKICVILPLFQFIKVLGFGETLA
jgi:hypothetical protein